LEQSEFIYFSGAQMYLKIISKSGLVYTVPTGNLYNSFGVHNVIDDTKEERKSIRILPFLYLYLFGLPYEYIKWYGLNQGVWWDPDVVIPPDISAASGFDFKIKTTTLISKVGAWGADWSWILACGWESARLTRLSKIEPKYITAKNLEELYKLKPTDEAIVRYYSSNVVLNHSYYGLMHPDNLFGIFDTAFEAYVEAISFLTSEPAEAYAYYYGYYEEYNEV
jgi:hypothetical protein